MPNALASAASPYLLQHADNPVDWREWSETAFAEARRRDVPVLLSVGYATCHWCHVMAHESFEDEATAAVMNELFVNIKVDREERPDVDRIYMDAVQAMSGHGGWPMTVFLSPDGAPFFAGTYFPKDRRGQFPAFQEVLASVADAWANRRDELEEQTQRLTAAVRSGIPAGDAVPNGSVIAAAVGAFEKGFDLANGGFGGAPKFPQAPNLELLLRVTVLDDGSHHAAAARTMLCAALDGMADGGINDQLGGGFSRYSVDAHWLVPHFEKMLYDNALLARLYLRAWQTTGVERYRTVAIATLDYLLRDLADPLGGFYSGEDADSEGVEGKFYVWDWSDLEEAAGDDLPLAAAVYGASPHGNFEGTNVLHRPTPLDRIATDLGMTPAALDERLADVSMRMLEIRGRRIRPSVDDKIVTSWNGLALRSLAEAGRILGDERYASAAIRLAEFTVSDLLGSDGRLVRTWRHGRKGPSGFCDDYGAMAVGLFTLYAATGDSRWYATAMDLVDTAVEIFSDPAGGFFATAADAERLITRPKNLFDNPTPSDNTLMAEALQMAAAYTGLATLAAGRDEVFRIAALLIEQHPSAVGHLTAVLATELAGIDEIAVIGEPQRRRPLEDVVWERFRPGAMLAAATGSGTSPPLLEGRTAGADAALAYVCRGFHCELPVSEPQAMRARLGDAEGHQPDSRLDPHDRP